MTETTEGSNRGSITRERLLRTAEQLFTERGIAKTPTRAIVHAAGQRNESALQYHFGSREGLISALYSKRGAQVAHEREMMLDAYDREATSTQRQRSHRVRRLCEVGFRPAVLVAQADPTFVEFLKLVGQLAFLPGEALRLAQTHYEGESINAVGERLRPLLTVPDRLLTQRLELMNRMATLALSQRARVNEPFEGPDAELFFANLADSMAAVLQAEVSPNTARRLRTVETGK